MFSLLSAYMFLAGMLEQVPIGLSYANVRLNLDTARSLTENGGLCVNAAFNVYPTARSTVTSYRSCCKTIKLNNHVTQQHIR